MLARTHLNYPTSAPERDAKRKAILHREIQRARETAARLGRSMTCSAMPESQHGRCVGARGCLCPCHDEKADHTA